MKNNILFTILLLIISLSACKDDSTLTGQSAFGNDESTDGIIVKADTFGLTSTIKECKNIISSPDYFLVGEIETSYGALKSDILTQFSCPIGYQYPANATLDSVCIFLYYNQWTGDSLTPLAITAYEMDRQTLQYERTYNSDIALSDYCSMTDANKVTDEDCIIIPSVWQDTVVTSSSSGETIKQAVIRMKASAKWANDFFAIRDFDSQEEFNKKFGGLCITSTFGSSNVLQITTIAIGVYYTFQYRKYGSEQDTIVHDMKGFYANSEVRQVNHFEYLNRQALMDSLDKNKDIYNYIIAPAGVYTQLNLPMGQMADSITSKIHGKRAYVNLARLKVDAIYDINKADSKKDRDDWAAPAEYILLLADSLEDVFFSDKNYITTDYAVLSQRMTGQDSQGYSYYYYSFDLSTLLTYQLREKHQKDTLRLTMVPVTAEYATSSSGTSSLSAVKQAQTISNTIFSSPNNSQTPMQLEVIYSGF